MLRRHAAIVAIFCVTALGSGALQYLHEMDHARQDARQDAMVRAAGLPVKPHHHDDGDCEICAQLHMALTIVAWVPLLICLGLFVAFLTLLDTPLIHRLLPVRIDCRGPPDVSHSL